MLDLKSQLFRVGIKSLRRNNVPINGIRRKHRMSQLYRPSSGIPDREKNSKAKGGSLSNSQKLMVDLGLIQASSTPGCYNLLPIAKKSLEKLEKIVDHFMDKIEAQKIQLPTLTSAALWKATGRLNGGPELMKMQDRHSKEFLLSPTHEEAICDMVRSHPLNHKALPLRLYQMTMKFRDELRPRFGLLRGREFLMKDLYTFDKDEESAIATYSQVNDAYAEIFDHIGVPWRKAFGATGTIGGSLSHEYHFPCQIGEDEIMTCNKCDNHFNSEILKEREERVQEETIPRVGGEAYCSLCGSTRLRSFTSIEVAHSFLLGTKYTKPLKVTYIDHTTKPQLLEMGCYGIGMTRLLAAAIEVLSEEDEIRWPLPLVPYIFAIIPPKAGSKEEAVGRPFAEQLREHLDVSLPGETLIDDRTDLTIGRRFRDMKKLGIPYIISLGKRYAEHKELEFYDMSMDHKIYIIKSEMFCYLYDFKSQFKLLK